MNKYFVKASEVKDRGQALRPHTARALKKLEKQDGLLVDHSMGSGKTLLYLKAIEAYQKKNPTEQTLIIAPASLTSNVGKEIRKHGVDIDMSRLEILSYEKATIDADRLKKKVYGMVVADESHRLRNSATKRHKELSEIIVKAKKRVLGTGTTAYNHASDIGPLVNLAAGRRVLPEGKAEFEARYIRKSVEQPPFLKRILGHPPKEIHHLKNKGELEKILRAHIDHYDLRDDPSAKDKFPEKIETVKEVQMSPEQSALYKYMEGKLPFHLRMKVRMNMPLDKKDVASLQAFSTGIRQVSNSMNAFMPNYDKPTPKIQAAVDSVHKGLQEDKNFRALVYSNYLDSGLNDYSKELTKRGIKHSIYHGALNSKQKDALLEKYNKGEEQVMLISSSGAEGLNTKGTKKIQVLEPHFNKSKLDQVVARGVRYESHEHLPKAERKVEVEHYLSAMSEKKFKFGPKQHSIDQYLHHNAKTKAAVGDQLKELVKEAATILAENPHVRARYKDGPGWESLKDPVGTVKRDGGAFFMTIDSEGKPRFVSRRPSVKGGYPDRTEKLPHLASIRLPDFAGHTYHTELVHTGRDAGEFPVDSHAAVSGILNSLKEKAIRTQEQTGPVRAVLVDVLHPKYPTYAEKLEHLKRLTQAAGKPDVLHTPTIKIGRAEILDLIEKTKGKKQEGVIVTSLSTPEDSNVRYKIKHVDTYNLEVVDVIQEEDILGNPKESMGALLLKDASGRIVGKVGTGFSREDRIQMWKNKALMPETRIQVKAMPPTASKLRAPVYNGYADGELDTVKEWSGQ